MDIITMIKNQDNENWHPLHTSTPIKPFRNNLIQKPLRKPGDTLNAVLNRVCNKKSFNIYTKNISSEPQAKLKFSQKTKTSVKNKGSCYFDVSSSSDEEVIENYKVPEIKILAKDTTKAKPLKIKICDNDKLRKGNSGSVKINADKVTDNFDKKTVSKNIKVNARKNQTKIVLTKSDCNNTNLMICHGTKKQTLGINENNNILISDEEKENMTPEELKNRESSLMDKVGEEGIVTDHRFKDAKNNIAYVAKGSEKLVNLLVSNERSISKGMKENPKYSDNTCKSEFNDNSKVVSNKRKANKLNKSGPKKKVKRKSEKVNVQKSEEESKESQIISPLHVWDKGNLTHQLFSDSKEQEHLNSLDLTTVEFNEPINKAQSPFKKILKKSLQKSKVKHELKLTDVSEKKTVERPTRQRQAPKEFWLTESQRSESIISSNKSKNLKEMLKSPNISGAQLPKDHKVDYTIISIGIKGKQECDDENVKENFSLSRQLKEQILEKSLMTGVENKKSLKTFTAKKSIRKKNIKNIENCGDNDEKTKLVVSGRITRQKVANKLVNNGTQLREHTELSKGEKVESEICSGFVKPVEPDMFRKLDQLKFFEESQAGCLTAECWSLKNFKCGVFKVLSRSELSAATSYNNSYFGVVLLKGSLKVTIENDVLQLNEGDMACIPPLKKWSAFNNSESESIVYYWCGRFKT